MNRVSTTGCNVVRMRNDIYMKNRCQMWEGKKCGQDQQRGDDAQKPNRTAPSSESKGHVNLLWKSQ
jgi:hypothetical protein